MDLDYLSKLPSDLFIKEITYLPFKDVISVCSSSKILHEKCMTNNNRWKSLIYTTFKDIHNFSEKLKEIQDKLSTKGFNYLIYTQLINILDKITQLMIYHKQNDMESFNYERFNDGQRMAALFLLNERSALEKYPDSIWVDILNNNYTEDNLNDALIDMARYGNMKGVIMMLEKGADINTSDGSPLYFAAKNKHFDVVKYLVENGATIENEDWEDQPIEGAAIGGNLETIKYFIKHGANLNKRSFVYALANGHFHLINYFISTGFKIEDVADDAFVNAVEKDRSDVLEYLLPYLQDKEGIIQESYNTIVGYGKLDTVKYLISKGAKVRNADLLSALRKEDLDLVKLLVENGADIHFDNDQVFVMAASYDHLDIVKYLLSKGINIHTRNDTALIMASYHGHLEMVKLLVENGADIHAGNDAALIYTVQNNRPAIVKYLVEQGADIHADDNKLLLTAKINNFTEIHDFLLSVTNK